MKNKLPIPIVAVAILILLLACSTLSTKTILSTPAPNPDAPVSAISTGGMHSCALLKNGDIMCWGSNEHGQLGDGTLSKHNTANLVPGLSNAIAVSAGGNHTCALLNEGSVKCWGQNTSWQLGDGTNTSRLTPTDVNLNGKAIAISAGDEHTCALMSNKEVKCWGKNLYGRLGIDSFARIGKMPKTVKNLEDVVMISADGEHTCALINTGAVKCWGHGSATGDGLDKNAKTPIDVVNLEKNILSIATGSGTTCALDNSGDAKCWGFFSLEQDSITPERIKGLGDDMVAIGTGGSHICAITNQGEIKCLGENEYGQLGNGTTHATYKATKVINLTGKAIEISTSLIYTCALVDNGNVLCWGNNSAGQLGNGTYDDSSKPVAVIGFK